MSAGRYDDGTTRQRANREASGWAILLQEEPEDLALRAKFSVWLDASTAHQAAWNETQRITQVIQTAPPAFASQWERNKAVILPFVVRRAGRGAGIAALAAAACFAFIAAPTLLLNLGADVSTGTGEMRSVQLADGSTMLVAPQSAVAFDIIKGGERQVRLLKGRAWFEVAPDRNHPFRVFAADTTTTVLGTGFEVNRAGESKASVVVKHGHVRVSCDDQIGHVEELKAGDALDMQCDEPHSSRTRIDTAQIAAWTDSQIVASDRPVMEVIDALRPWQTGFIFTIGKGFADRRVTGVYDARQPAHVLQALALSQNMRVRNVTPWITVISAD